MYWIAAFAGADVEQQAAAYLRLFDQYLADEQRRIQILIDAQSTARTDEMVLLTIGRDEAPEALTQLGEYGLFWCMNDAAKQAFSEYGINIRFVAHGPDDQAPKGLYPKIKRTRQVILA